MREVPPARNSAVRLWYPGPQVLDLRDERRVRRGGTVKELRTSSATPEGSLGVSDSFSGPPSLASLSSLSGSEVDEDEDEDVFEDAEMELALEQQEIASQHLTGTPLQLYCNTPHLGTCTVWCTCHYLVHN